MSLYTRLRTVFDTTILLKRNRLRWGVRTTCLVLFAVSASALVPALSPFVAVASLLATRTFHPMVWLGLGVGLAVLMRRRLLCRWICPVGLCLDGASRFGRRLGRRAIAGWPLGQWIVLLTLGSAILGYPFLLWLDPLAIFAGLLPSPGHGLGFGVYLSIAGFLGLLLLHLLWPGFWCGRVCPLGAFQDLLSSLRPRRVALGRCVRRQRPLGGSLKAGRPWGWQSPQNRPIFIPRKTIPKLRLRLPPVLTYPLAEKHAVGLFSRRAVLGVAAGTIWATAARLRGREVPHSLRPPGALEDPTFRAVCTRCGNCLRACPSRVIERDARSNDLGSLLTPVLSFRTDYCREDCVRCTEVCPSGTLRRMSLAEKAAMRLGLPRVDMNVCLLAEDRECSLCRSRCPYEAIRYVFSEASYTLTPQIDPRKCTGCGACEVACPTTPAKAIVVRPASVSRG